MEILKVVIIWGRLVLEDKVRKATGNIVKRASACLESGGGLFEFRLKKKRGIEPEV